MTVFFVGCNRHDNRYLNTSDLKNIELSYIREKAIFSFWPTDKDDTIINNNSEPSSDDLKKYSIKETINVQLMDNFEDSVALYINKKLVVSGFFKSNYQATNTLYSALQFKSELLNTRKVEYAQIHVAMPWKKVYLDTLVPLRHSNIYIYHIDSWIIKFK
jgi:hypothetical protein